MSIKETLIKGIGYTAIAKYSGVIISLIISAILARLLSPEDFGVVAIAMVIITFFGIISDLGISPAIIQNKDLDKEDLTELFVFTIWLGLGLSFLFFLSASLISHYYKSPVLIHLCQLLSINLFFNTINIVPNALLYKDKAFKYLAVRSLIVQSIVGILAILAALWGAGLYALLINPIISSGILFWLSYRKYPLPFRFTSGITAIQKIFSYSLYQFLFNLINYFSRNLDKLLIGKYLGMNALGYYEKSYRLMMLPIQNITYVITPVMHPVLSDFQNDHNYLASSYEKIVRILAFIGFPLSIFLFFTAKELTLILFGSQWLPSVPIFQILALSAGIQIILSSSGSIFQAANDTKSLFICGLFSSITNIIGICLGVFLFKNLETLAICICSTFSINFIQCYWQMYIKTFVKRSIRSFIHQLYSPLLLSSILFIILFPIYIVSKDWNMFMSLIIKASASLITYFTYLYYKEKYNIFKFISHG